MAIAGTERLSISQSRRRKRWRVFEVKYLKYILFKGVLRNDCGDECKNTKAFGRGTIVLLFRFFSACSGEVLRDLRGENVLTAEPAEKVRKGRGEKRESEMMTFLDRVSVTPSRFANGGDRVYYQEVR